MDSSVFQIDNQIIFCKDSIARIEEIYLSSSQEDKDSPEWLLIEEWRMLSIQHLKEQLARLTSLKDSYKAIEMK
jgi:hypothetical protein